MKLDLTEQELTDLCWRQVELGRQLRELTRVHNANARIISSRTDYANKLMDVIEQAQKAGRL